MYLQKNALDLGIVTSNEAAMLGFYRDTLELPLVGEVPVQGVGVIKKIQCGDSVIKLLVLAQPPQTSNIDATNSVNAATNFGATSDSDSATNKNASVASENASARPRGGFASAVGYRYCTLTVQNLEAVVDRCRAGGHRISVEIVSPRPGLRAAMVEDPDGNTVELMSMS